MARVSVLIPSRNEPFLNRTIDDVFKKATGDIEVIVLLDGAPPTEPIPERPGRLLVIERGRAKGIGAASWHMARLARGEYIMKLDAHCLLAPGFDEALAAHCDYKDLLVPARKPLLFQVLELACRDPAIVTAFSGLPHLSLFLHIEILTRRPPLVRTKSQ